MSIDNAGILFTFGLFSLVIAVVITVIWQVFKLVRTKHETRASLDYEELARDSVATQRELRTELSELRGEISEIRGRVVAIEKMLREVDS